MDAKFDQLDELREKGLARVRDAADSDALRLVEREFLEKGGVIAALLAEIPKLDPKQRRDAGQGANKLKSEMQSALQEKREALLESSLMVEAGGGLFDPTLPAAPTLRGSLHPITQVTREVESIFQGMGYQVLDGPEVELDFYNFQALNIPSDHPAREHQDTFWCDNEQQLVLRTQTSPVQIRAMETMEPPFRVIVPGRVFRNEALDATHEHTFHQVEGLVVGENVNVGQLIGTLKSFLSEIFRCEIDVRLRPGFFPFVEPGFEVDIRCPFCKDGCRVCKNTTWVEYCGCGMVHPNVLSAGGLDAERWSAFAFGMGLDRLVMMRNKIDDLRHFMGGDLRFLEQF
ncbi:MAG: phenylalanyl-tRNA synthetase alpha chain [Planctomycetota bacterium]|jgi:phenylalanyl-tRNA synthetase alpha chain